MTAASYSSVCVAVGACGSRMMLLCKQLSSSEFAQQAAVHPTSLLNYRSKARQNPRVPRCAGEHEGSRHGVARCGESNSLVRLEPCLCMVLWQINSACVAGAHTPAKPVCGRHVAGAVVL